MIIDATGNYYFTPEHKYHKVKSMPYKYHKRLKELKCMKKLTADQYIQHGLEEQREIMKVTKLLQDWKIDLEEALNQISRIKAKYKQNGK